jgi:glycosyltransferase involved in cell wall biosynthesis
MESSNLSVIIITKNEGEVIESCLGSVFGQSIQPLEVLIVDGGSTDDTLEKSRLYPVKILMETGKPSPSNARNLGVLNAQGEIVLVMGADAELGKECIKNVLKYFERPDIAAVVPTLEVKVHTRLEKLQKDWFYGTRSRFRTEYGTGSSIQFIRKDIYLKYKFDDGLGLGDDSDFRRRMARNDERTGKKTEDHSRTKADKVLLADSMGRARALDSIVKARDCKVFVNLPHSLSEVKSQYIWYGRTSPPYIARYLRERGIGLLISLGSVLAPTILLISCVITLVFPFAAYFTILLLVLLIARNVIICARSRSMHFFEFLFFDFFRSFFYIVGLIQGIFKKKTGR